MPIYEYRCRKCGHQFSVLSRPVLGADEEQSPVCPECGENDTVRVVSSFAVHGPSGPDPAEVRAQKAHEEKLASITPKEQISQWRAAKQKGGR